MGLWLPRHQQRRQPGNAGVSYHGVQGVLGTTRCRSSHRAIEPSRDRAIAGSPDDAIARATCILYSVGTHMGRIHAVALMLSLTSTVAAAQPRVFRSGVDLVYFNVAVLDNKGKLVDGLKADDFEVLEDGKPQRISYFFSGLEKAE